MIQTLPIPLPPHGPAPDPTLADLVYRSRLSHPGGPLGRGDRGRVAGLSLLIYGLLGAAIFAVGAEATLPAAPSRTVTLSLVEAEPLPGAALAPERPLAVGGPAGDPQPSPIPQPPSPQEPTPSSDGGAPAAGPGPAGTPGGGLLGGGLPGGGGSHDAGKGSSSTVLPPSFEAAYLQNPSPDYPSLSRRLREEGRVILRVWVKEDGRPDTIELRQTSGHDRLDRAALEAVRRWRFAPARRGSECLAAWVLVPLSFSLDA